MFTVVLVRKVDLLYNEFKGQGQKSELGEVNLKVSIHQSQWLLLTCVVCLTHVITKNITNKISTVDHAVIYLSYRGHH